MICAISESGQILLWIGEVLSITSAVTILGSLAIAFWLIVNRNLLFGSFILQSGLVIGVCVLAWIISIFGLPKLFAWLGYLSPEEADDYVFYHGWPESWLEEISDSDKNR